MRTLILSHRDLRTLVGSVGVHTLMDELIDRLMIAFATFDEAETEIPARTGFYYDVPGTGLIEWMPLFKRHESVLMKIVGYHPESPNARNLPAIVSTLSTYDIASGHLTALVDGTFLTALRTGAASAVASKLLASPQSEVLGLIGGGAQAVTQLHAISRVFPVAEVLIYDLDPAVSESFPARARPITRNSPEIHSASLETVIARSDIISVATSVDVGSGPVFDDSATQPWTHVNAVGSDLPGKTELPRELLENSFVCPDNPIQASLEGECQQLNSERVGPGLVEVARNPDAYKSIQQQKSVFDSTGWALEDHVALQLVLEYAEQFGLGSTLQIECIADDPRNPYDFLQQDEDSTNLVPASRPAPQ